MRSFLCRAPSETVRARPSTRNLRLFLRRASLESFHRKVDSLRSREEAAEHRRETTPIEMRSRVRPRAFWQSSLKAQQFRQKPQTARAASDYATCGTNRGGHANTFSSTPRTKEKFHRRSPVGNHSSLMNNPIQTCSPTKIPYTFRSAVEARSHWNPS